MLHDLPGVGENLQDHIGGRIIYRCIAGASTMNEIYHNWLRRRRIGLQYVLAHEGPLMTGAGPIGLFVKTRPELDSPDVQYQFLAGSAPKAGDPMHRFPGLHAGGDPVPAGKPRLAAHHRRPIRRKPPAMQPNYLSTQRDRDTIVAGAEGRAAHLRHPGDAAIRHARRSCPARRQRPTRTCWTTCAPPAAPPSTRPAPA